MCSGPSFGAFGKSLTISYPSLWLQFTSLKLADVIFDLGDGELPRTQRINPRIWMHPSIHPWTNHVHAKMPRRTQEAGSWKLQNCGPLLSSRSTTTLSTLEFYSFGMTTSIERLMVYLMTAMSSIKDVEYPSRRKILNTLVVEEGKHGLAKGTVCTSGGMDSMPISPLVNGFVQRAGATGTGLEATHWQ